MIVRGRPVALTIGSVILFPMLDSGHTEDEDQHWVIQPLPNGWFRDVRSEFRLTLYIAHSSTLDIGLSTVSVYTVIRAPVIRARDRTVWHSRGHLTGRSRDGYPPYQAVKIRPYTAVYGRMTGLAILVLSDPASKPPLLMSE